MKKLNKNGQSLIEVLIALTILTMTLSGLFLMFSSSLRLFVEAQDATRMSTLIQEAIETVKHERNVGCGFNNFSSFGTEQYNSSNPGDIDFFYLKGDIEGKKGDIEDEKDMTLMRYNTSSGVPICTDPLGSEVSCPENDLDKDTHWKISGYENIKATRRIYLYPVEEELIPEINPKDPNNIESPNDYYNIKVVITWRGREWKTETDSRRSHEISTIMLKRWKDI